MITRMMNWKVIYKDNDGKPTESFFEADSRTDLFKALTANGITALRVEESKHSQQMPRRKIFRLNEWKIATLVFVGLFVTACALFATRISGKTNAVAIQRDMDGHKPIKVIPGNSGTITNKVSATVSSNLEPVQPKREIWLGHEIVSSKVVTNGSDLVITRIDTEGKVHKEYTSIHKRLFSNPVDITLSILLTTPDGALTPPLPPLGPRSSDVFADSLKRPIEISEDDTPEERRIKQLVMAAREEMLDELRNGKTVDEVIEDHCTYVDNSNRLRAEAMVRYKEMLAEGDEGLAEEFRVKANELLVKKGAHPLKSQAEIYQERMSNRGKKK